MAGTKRKSISKDASDSEGSEPLPSTSTVKKPKKYAKQAAPQEENAASDSAEGVKVHTSDDGGKYVELGKKKRVSVRSFKGNTLVDIREFYGDPEQPGKKGISLSLEQWKTLRESADTIDKLIAKMK